MRKPSSNSAAHALAHCTLAFRNRLVVGGTPIELYADSWFVNFHVVVLHMMDTKPHRRRELEGEKVASSYVLGISLKCVVSISRR